MYEAQIGWEIITLRVRGDERGSLIALEQNDEIPFDIRRIYYLFDTKADVLRGCHAHKTLKQLLICVSGSCKLSLDNGVVREEIYLSAPDRGVFLYGFVWRELFEFSKDCVLVVVANQHYDERDYVRDYSEFRQQVNTMKENVEDVHP